MTNDQLIEAIRELVKDNRKGEQLLSVKDTAARLGISRTKFLSNLDKLAAKGLQVVKVGQQRKFRERSVDKIIKRAADREERLF